MNQHHIKLNKKKTGKLFAVSLICFVLSLLFVVKPGWFLSAVISSKTVILAFGILGLLFFGIASLYSFRKMTNKNLGLFMDDKGVTDHSNSFGFGLVEWKDIKTFKLSKSSKQQIILIETTNPGKYTDRIQSPVFRKAAEQNEKLYGSPVIVWCSVLNADPDQLEALLKAELKKRK